MLTRTKKTNTQTPKHPNSKAPELWRNSPAMLSVFARISAERGRQKLLYLTGKITFDCASTLPDPNRKFRVLTEELGEVAKELDKLEQLRDRRGEKFVLEDLRDELVQVAAVAVAWLESLEIQNSKLEIKNGGAR